MWYLILIFWLIVFGLIIWQQRKTIAENEDKIEALIAEGLRLQNNAIETVENLRLEKEQADVAWQKGLDDQVEIYDAMILDEKDKVEKLEKDVEALMIENEKLGEVREMNERLITRLTELEIQHIYHEDHCLPVLQHMRKAVTV